MSIKEEIFNRYSEELTFDEPIEYEGLLLYPVSIKKITKFLQASSILRIQKEYIPDKEIIKMSYLKYLITSIRKEKEEFEQSITLDLLALCFMIVLRIEEISIRYYTEDNKSGILINDVEIDDTKFDYLRKIILYQNIPNYDDELINPDLKKDMELADKLKNGNSDSVDMEHQISNLIIGTGMNMEDVKNLSIRKFYIIAEMLDSRIHYSIYKQASVSGFVEFKKPITHYLKKENNDLLENKVTTVDTLRNNMNI